MLSTTLAAIAPAAGDPRPPFVMEGGGKVNEQDMYVQLTITAEGEWRARVNSKATSHVLGSCGNWRARLLDSGSNTIAVLGGERFCVGTKDGVGGLKERDDYPNGRLSKDQVEKIYKVEIGVAADSKSVWQAVVRDIKDALK